MEYFFDELKSVVWYFKHLDEEALWKHWKKVRFLIILVMIQLLTAFTFGHLLPYLDEPPAFNQATNLAALVGGATGLIGDPSFKDEIVPQTKETVQEWACSIQGQLSLFPLILEMGTEAARKTT